MIQWMDFAAGLPVCSQSSGCNSKFMIQDLP